MAIVLGLCLVGWLWYSVNEQKKASEAAREAMAAEAARNAEIAAQGGASTTNAAPAAVAAPSTGATATAPAAATEDARNAVKKRIYVQPEQLVTLSNAHEVVVLSSHGASVKSVTLLDYARDCGKISAENPPVALDFADSPALAVEGDFAIIGHGADFVLFRSPTLERRLTLREGYRIAVEEKAVCSTDGVCAMLPNDVSLGVMTMGTGKNDLLSVDAWVPDPKGGKVMHYGEEEPLKSYLVSSVGGCSGKPNAAGMPETSTVPVPGRFDWVAVKNRFFVTAICGMASAANGFSAAMTRDASQQDYVLKSVAATVELGVGAQERAYTFYAGPKKQALLWDLGMRDVMEFGMWRWVCYPLVWVLNLFYSWIPSFGIGIILLTILVRLLFWPLTHKSTISMRRMSEIQPKMKEIREKFKDNPQRMQQETWALYKDNKVNPLASCLPMLVQIPVFIALFTVLRSAVELRYAPFLWIADLSEPENLFPTIFPFGGLNILPILMAVTMGLQSALTPSTGDKSQQRMMMIMMPVMMLVMFYSFPSALSLYWTLSQVLSIVQMWYIRKKYTPAPIAAANDTVEAQVVTRQMRRHGGA